MALNFPDIAQHNNPNNAFVDSNFIRGGTRSPVGTLSDLYAIGAAGLDDKSDQLKQNATRVYVSGEAKFYVLKDYNNRTNSNGWEVDGGGGLSSNNFISGDGTIKTIIKTPAAGFNPATADPYTLYVLV
jgi:hypothetical protein